MLYVNGRFLTQPISGVQRYAWELLGALDDLLEAQPGALGPVEVLVPRAVTPPAWKALRLRIVPGGRGHGWEQVTLARAAWDGVLLSLGNSGPLAHPRHVLCLHDAHIYEMPQAFSPRYRLWHRALRPALARRAAALITVSDHSAQQLGTHLKLDPARFNIVPNSAEHVLRLPAAPGAPRHYGLTPGGYLLSVGNQSPNKNLAALALAHAAAGSDTLPLAIVGGDVPGIAQARPERSGLHLLGRVPDADLRGLYEGAAGFVFPSLHEGFGIPPLEAMQLGVPVLCARSGAMPEVLGDAPIWFSARDPADINRALRAFAGLSAGDRAAMVARGRKVAARYTWRGSAAKMLQILERLLNEMPPAAQVA
ncbi:MAG: glycosyltransferase family 1 protein [Pseudomonadota bacterium]